jgi:zinc and cadmium transporter
MAMTLGGLCVAIVIVSFLGGILPLATVLTHTRLQVYLSFSAGAMLGAAFFHMLPEAVRIGSAGTIPWAALGLLALFFLERFFSFHHHESHEHPAGRPSEQGPAQDGLTGLHAEGAMMAVEPALMPPPAAALVALPWGWAAFGLAVHSLVGGVALASAVGADFAARDRAGATALGVFAATLLHKPADALTITALMIRSGAARWSAHAVNVGFALMIPLGVVLFTLGTGVMPPGQANAWTAAALAFSAGTFLCIALSDLLPELQFHSHDRLKLSFALLAGFALMAGTAALEPDRRAAPNGPQTARSARN